VAVHPVGYGLASAPLVRSPVGLVGGNPAPVWPGTASRPRAMSRPRIEEFPRWRSDWHRPSPHAASRPHYSESTAHRRVDRTTASRRARRAAFDGRRVDTPRQSSHARRVDPPEPSTADGRRRSRAVAQPRSARGRWRVRQSAPGASTSGASTSGASTSARRPQLGESTRTSARPTTADAPPIRVRSQRRHQLASGMEAAGQSTSTR